MPNNDEKKVLLKVTDLKQWFPLKKTKLFQKEQEYVRRNYFEYLRRRNSWSCWRIRMWKINIWKNFTSDLQTDRR